MNRIVFALVLALASPALAGNDSAVAVLDIQGSGVSPDLLPTLTEILTVEIAELGIYKVIAGRDIQSMLGFERQKDVLGCTDAACLAEIGGALGVDRIVASQVGKVGSTYVVNIKLINIRQADTEGRVYETVRGEVDALIEIVKKSVQKLLGPGSKAALARQARPAPPAVTAPATPAPVVAEPPPVVSTPAPVVTKPSPAPVVTAPPPSTEVAIAPPLSVETKVERRIGVVPWVFWGLGGAALAGGLVVGNQAKSLSDKANDPNQPGSQVAAVDAESKAKTASILGIVGAVSIAAGFGWYFFLSPTVPVDTGSTTLGFSPVLLPGGGGLAAVGTF